MLALGHHVHTSALCMAFVPGSLHVRMRMPEPFTLVAFDSQRFHFRAEHLHETNFPCIIKPGGEVGKVGNTMRQKKETCAVRRGLAGPPA